MNLHSWGKKKKKALQACRMREERQPEDVLLPRGARSLELGDWRVPVCSLAFCCPQASGSLSFSDLVMRGTRASLGPPVCCSHPSSSSLPGRACTGRVHVGVLWRRGDTQVCVEHCYTESLLCLIGTHHFNLQVLGSISKGTGIMNPDPSGSKGPACFASLGQRCKLRTNCDYVCSTCIPRKAKKELKSAHVNMQ